MQTTIEMILINALVLGIGATISIAVLLRVRGLRRAMEKDFYEVRFNITPEDEETETKEDDSK